MFATIAIVTLACVFAALITWMGIYEHKLTNQLILGNLENADLARQLDISEDKVTTLTAEVFTLERDLGSYIASNLFDAWTIRNLTASVEALSAQLDEYAVAHAKAVLGGEEIVDDCTCAFNYDDRIEAPCKDASCTCVHHKFASLEADEL